MRLYVDVCTVLYQNLDYILVAHFNCHVQRRSPTSKCHFQSRSPATLRVIHVSTMID